MASFYTSSPTVVLPPQHNNYFGHTHLQQSPTELASSYFNRTNPASKSLSSIASRKRSRDDDDDDDNQQPTLAAHVQPPVNSGEPTYGPGMTLVYPNNLSGSYNADASSQSGTWGETQNEAAVAHAQRPIVTSRKSQRLDSSAPKPDDITALAQPEMRRANTTEPLIDEITRLLGISWARMDGSDALRISQKAYTRWVQRHYPGLTDVELWFENSSIPGYLGVATNKSFGGKEFLLWSQDLKQAVLVTREPSEIIAKLMSPSAILGSATTSMFASDEPVADDNNCSSSPTISLPTAAPQVVAAAMDVD